MNICMFMYIHRHTHTHPLNVKSKFCYFIALVSSHYNLSYMNYAVHVSH